MRLFSMKVPALLCLFIGIMLILHPTTASQATFVSPIVSIFGNAILAGIVFVLAGAAVIGTTLGIRLTTPALLIATLPMGVLLSIGAFEGAFRAVLMGQYADHTVVPWPHILADQSPYLILVGTWFWAVVTSCLRLLGWMDGYNGGMANSDTGSADTVDSGGDQPVYGKAQRTAGFRAKLGPAPAVGGSGSGSDTATARAVSSALSGVRGKVEPDGETAA